MKRLSVTMAAVAALLVGVAPAAARGQGPGGGAGGPGVGKMFRSEMLEQVAAELGVSEAVVKQIKDKAYKADQDAIKVRADLDAARLEMRRLMDEDKPDQARVLKQVEQVGALETELKKNRIRLLLSVRELMTPDQRKKLQKILSERMGGRGMGMGPDGDEGRGMGPGMRRRGPGAGF